jgi:NAD(P)-dependent dehydrogenase (short-subunit alcohol dehydrogenase family)
MPDNASNSNSRQGQPAQPLQNPADKYPKPPFARQSQPWPGLAGAMIPPPDHGEHSYQGSGRLQGRRALITGGDSGMGRAAAIAFAREGADVAINYLPAEEPDAQQVIDLIRSAGRNGVAIPGDLRDAAFCRTLVQAATNGLGGLDILVNNAAHQQTRPSVLDVPDLYDYAQTKAATMNYVKSLAKQLAGRGIRVNGVAPGPIWTPLQVSGGATMEKLESFGGSTPMGRPGQPAELASIYVQLVAADASYATGQVYGSGGGSGQP